MNDDDQILALLARRNLSAEALRRELDLGHEQIYCRLVRLEAQGRVQVLPTYNRDRCSVEWRIS